jgi:hypothetical protein
VAVFFYRWHALDPLGIRAMLPLLEPVTPHVLDSTTMGDYVTSLFADLQRDIIDAHEIVARSLLLSEWGQTIIEKQQEQRYVCSDGTSRNHCLLMNMCSARHVKVTFPSVPAIEKNLNLQFHEVATLWTPIYGVVHPGHWDPAQFRSYPREHYDALRAGSHKIIREMVELLTFGGHQATMTISVDARFRMLLSSSVKKIINPHWPTLHPDLPSALATDTWSARADLYESACQSNGLRLLLDRLGGMPQLHGASVNPDSINIHSVINAIRGEGQLDDDESSDSEELYSRPSRPAPPNRDNTPDSADGLTFPVDKPDTPQHNSQASLHDADIQTKSANPDSQPQNTTSRESTPSIARDPDSDDEETFTVDDLAQHDAPVGMSTFFTIGSEQENVTEEMVSTIKGMVDEDWQADVAVIAGVVQANSAWDEITTRALTIGRLGYVGAAHYVLQGLAQEYSATAELVRHFTGRMDTYEELMLKLVEARQRSERSRYILDGAVSVADGEARKLAGARHEELMRVYGASRSRPSTTRSASPGPGFKRKASANDPDAIRSLLKKARRGGQASNEAGPSTARSKYAGSGDRGTSRSAEKQRQPFSTPGSRDSYTAPTTPLNDETPTHSGSRHRDQRQDPTTPSSIEKRQGGGDSAASIAGSSNKGKGHATTIDKDSSKHYQGGGDHPSSGQKGKQRAPVVQSFGDATTSAKGGNMGSSFADDMDSLED